MVDTIQLHHQHQHQQQQKGQSAARQLLLLVLVHCLMKKADEAAGHVVAEFPL
jgi:hypothetical protein